MTPRFPSTLALAATLFAGSAALAGQQTADVFHWTGPTPPTALMGDPRFSMMWRWLDAQRHIPGTVPPMALPHDDSSPPIPLPPIEDLSREHGRVTPLPPVALAPMMGLAMRLASPLPRPAVDADHDGTVSAEEAAAHAEAVFAALDTDHDGGLDKQEFLRMGAVPFPGFTELENSERQGRFDSLDGNADGRIAKAEFMDVGRAHYEAARDTLTGEVTPWSYRRTDWY